MIVARETIYAAVFGQFNTALLSPAGPFKTVSRRWQDPSQISPADRPAFYQVQKRETAANTQKIPGLPLRWIITVDLVIYTAGDSEPNVVQSTELNNLLDAVEAALPNVVKGAAQTLGLFISDARIEGPVEIVENVQGTMAMAVVPVSIIVGA